MKKRILSIVLVLAMVFTLLPVSVSAASRRIPIYVGNLQVDYKIHGLEELRANLNLGYDVAKSTGSRFDVSGSPQAALNTTFKDIGQGATWNSLRRNLLLDFYVNYNKELPTIESRVDAMLGYSWQHFYNSDYDITKSNPILPGEKEGWIYNEADGRYWQEG